MAWVCLKCDKKIFAPRRNSLSFVVEWKYDKKTQEVNLDIKRLDQIKEGSHITHLNCQNSSNDEEFNERLKKVLGIPKTAFHPLID